MKVGIIIQARMSSTRLPGKVLKKLAGKAVLWHVVERCRKSTEVDEVIVATSTAPSDDELVDFCDTQGIPIFRGDLNNVLERYHDCAQKYGLDLIVRITSDCPFIEPEIIDASIRVFKGQEVDYVSNCLHRTFPRGLDCEVFSWEALKKAHESAELDSEKEHVTPYIQKHLNAIPYEVEPQYEGDFRLTLDEPSDYELIDLLYQKMYKTDGIDLKEVLEFLRNHPEVAAINAHVEQKKL